MSLVLGASDGFAVSSTSASDTFPTGTTTLRVSANIPCAFRTGVGAQTAVLTDAWIAAGSELVIQIPGTHNTIAAITEGAATGRLSYTIVSSQED